MLQRVSGKVRLDINGPKTVNYSTASGINWVQWSQPRTELNVMYRLVRWDHR